MISYSEFSLDNGLRVIVHEDPTVQIAVMNILYDVGSRDERETKTGFAHLFEHRIMMNRCSWLVERTMLSPIPI